MQTVVARLRREGDDGGVAAVEFAIVASLLFMLLFGIITFGVLFGYRQQLTQSAAEGARAAVAVAYTPSSYANVQEAARTQVNKSIAGTKRQCPTLTAGVGGTLAADGIQCSMLVYPCSSTTAGTGTPTGYDDCLQVKVVLDNATKPLIGKLPLLSAVTPTSLTGTYVVRLAGYAP
jgi:Flp pilus assembly protein TadG